MPLTFCTQSQCLRFFSNIVAYDTSKASPHQTSGESVDAYVFRLQGLDGVLAVVEKS